MSKRNLLKAEISKMALENPELRKSLVPMLKTSNQKPVAGITVHDDSVIFDFAWKLGNAGKADELGSYISLIHKTADNTIKNLQQTLGGRKAYSKLDDLKWVISNNALRITGLTGVSGLTDAYLSEKIGNYEDYPKIIKKIVGKYFDVEYFEMDRDFGWDPTIKSASKTMLKESASVPRKLEDLSAKEQEIAKKMMAKGYLYIVQITTKDGDFGDPLYFKDAQDVGKLLRSFPDYENAKTTWNFKLEP
jgi:hypothetical protein